MADTKISREGEQQELHGLNVRLSNYLNRAKELEREKDALEAKMEMEAKLHRAALEEQRKQHEKDNEAMRNNLSNKIEQASALERGNKDLKEENTYLSSELYAATKERDDLKKKATRLEKDMQAVPALKAELESLRKQLAKAIEDRDKFHRQSDQYRELSAAAEAKVAGLESKIPPLREQLLSESELRKKECTALRNMIDDLKKAHSRELLEIREHSEKVIAESLSKQHKELDEVAKRDRDQLKLHHADVEQALRAESEEERRLRRAREQRVEDLTKELEKLAAEVSRLQSDLNDKQKELTLEQKRHAKESNEREKHLDFCREKLRNKEDEFNQLMDVKISLVNELKQYRDLLEMEEQRTGLTPAKKAKTAAKPSSKPRKQKGLHIQTLDLVNQKVTLMNDTSQRMALEGWMLDSKEGMQTFTFPQGFTLERDAVVSVWAGKRNQRKSRDPKTELWWSAKYIWAENGDVATLKSPEGAEISQMAVNASHETTHEAVTSTTEAGMDDDEEEEVQQQLEFGEDGQRKCVIM